MVARSRILACYSFSLVRCKPFAVDIRLRTLTPQTSDWNSLDDHHAFMKSAIYGSFGRHLMTIVEGPMSMYHTNFDPHPPSAAISSTSSPVTEVITCYFASHDPGFEEKVKKLAGIIKENTETFKAAAGGWIIEDVEHESIGSGTKGKAYAVVFGWDSVEAHMKFRETEAFKENIHLLREGPLKLEVHHTKFVEK